MGEQCLRRNDVSSEAAFIYLFIFVTLPLSVCLCGGFHAQSAVGLCGLRSARTPVYVPAPHTAPADWVGGA